VLVDAELALDSDGNAEFLACHAVDRVGQRLVFVDATTGDEPLAFRGLVRPLPEHDAVRRVDHEIDRHQRDVLDDHVPLLVRHESIGHTGSRRATAFGVPISTALEGCRER
jgi:hypothetical protein